MTIFESTVLIFACVTKNYTYTCARSDGNPAEVSRNWFLKALLLGSHDAHKVKICMALSVEIHLDGVEHHAPLKQ
ncbi:hypothetical protein M2396_004083 [Pseudomonas sp. BIGb0278]|nr:hypothetical protein [Pseudomonas sp. BIGb0278]